MTDTPRYVLSLATGNLWEAETGERLGYFTLDEDNDTDPGCVRLVMAGERFDHCSVDPGAAPWPPDSTAYRRIDNLVQAAELWAETGGRQLAIEVG